METYRSSSFVFISPNNQPRVEGNLRMYRNEVHLLFVVASTLVLGTFGCQGNGKPLFSNPFSASSRVPPPATRSLGPGSAQPYYPGDPVPVLQGATAPAGPPLVSTTPLSPTVPPPVAALKTPQIQPVSLVPSETAGSFRTVSDSRFTPPAAPVATTAPSPTLQASSPATQTLTSTGGHFVSPAAWRSPGFTANPGASPATPAIAQPATQTAPRIRLPGTHYVSPPTTGLPVPIQQASFVTTHPAAAGIQSLAVPQTAGVTPQPAPPATRPRPAVAHGWQTPSPYTGK